MREDLQALHREYEQLEQRGSRLNPDQRTSLRYYRAETSGPDIKTPRRVARWTRELANLERFIASQRWPRENNRLHTAAVDPEERRLAEWVRTQRKAIRDGRRCTYQVRRLECLPGFTTNPLDDRWRRRLDSYAASLRSHHGPPSSSSSDPDERALAAWAAKQRYLHRRGRLSPERARALESLSAWVWGR